MSTDQPKGLPDYVRQAGAAALGGRLRRLSERLDGESRQLHAAQGVAFEQRWLGVLDLLSEEPMSVRDLATRLGISHPSVSETRRSLESKGLVAHQADPADGRRRVLALTDEGTALVARLRPLWAALDQAAVELDAEAGNAFRALERLEEALAARPLTQRVNALLEAKPEKGG